MDLYILNSDTFRTASIIDSFTSLIWTERYNVPGDVTLVLPSTPDSKLKIREGIFLGIPDSNETMLIESVEDTKGTITATGNTLIDFFKTRPFRNAWNINKTSWHKTGFVGDIAKQIVQDMVMFGGMMDAGDILPGANGSNALMNNLSIGTNASGAYVDVAIDYGTLYDAIKTVLDLDSVGFNLIANPDGTTYTLKFNSYAGADRTSTQSDFEPVIFDPALDTLADTDEIRSIAGYMTAAYAFGAGMTDQSQIGKAFASGTSSFTDFNRRVLIVDASDVNASDYTDDMYLFKSILDQKAANALVNNNYVRTTDGELVPQGHYAFGSNYFMGDIVELRGSGTVGQRARITEYIRSQDNTGEKAYPTLSVIN